MRTFWVVGPMLLGQGVLAFKKENKGKEPGQAHRYHFERALVSSVGMLFSSKWFLDFLKRSSW